MNRVLISKSLWGSIFIMVLVLVLFGLAVLDNLGDDKSMFWVYVATSLPATLFFVVLVSQMRQVSHDGQLMYIVFRNNELNVPLRNVQSIETTTTSINGRSIWKIVYTDGHQQIKSVKILPKWGGKFEGFQSAVKTHNPQFIIKEKEPYVYND